MNNIIPFTGELIKRNLDIKKVIIFNEFASKIVELKYFKINMNDGRLDFNTPYGYFKEFMENTVWASDESNCMKNAKYDIHILFLAGEQKGTIIIQKPYLIACNNYGREEEHQILLQATEKELMITKGWIYGRYNKECFVQQPVYDSHRELQYRHKKELDHRT